MPEIQLSGNGPDARAADMQVALAAERTLLAWMRTGLALMGFGFVVARFGMFLRETKQLQEVAGQARASSSNGNASYSLAIGVALVALGVLVNGLAVFQHIQSGRRLRAGKIKVSSPAYGATLVSLLLAAIGVGMVVYLVFVAQ